MNLLPNPDFEIDLSGWARADTSVATLTRVTTEAHTGTASMKWDTTASTNVAQTSPGVACIAGRTYAGSMWLKGTGVCAVGIAFHDGGGAQIGTTVAGADVAMTAAWQQLTVAGVVAPSNAATVRFRIYQRNAGAQTVYLDDGNMAGSPTVTATPRNDLAAVLLEVAGMPAGPATITRTDANGTGEVRLQLGQEPSAGTLVVYDYEPALQGQATYTVVDSGDEAGQATADIDVAFPVLTAAVLPNLRASITMVDGYTRRRESAGIEHEVVDREDPIIVWTTPHRSPAGTVTVFCASFEDALALEAVVAAGEVLMFRQPTYAGMDMYCFAKASDISVRTWQTVPARWSLDLTYRTVRRPAGVLLGAAGWNYDVAAASLLSYDDMAARFTTYNALAVGP